MPTPNRQSDAPDSRPIGPPTRHDQYGVYWQAMVDQVATEADRSGRVKRMSFRWRELPDLHLVVSMFIADDKGHIGIFITGPERQDPALTRAMLEPHARQLEDCLNAPFIAKDSASRFFIKRTEGSILNPDHVPRLIEWHTRQADLYEATLRSVLGARS